MTACRGPGSPLPRGDGHLRWGNPSAASTRDPHNYLLTKPEYVLSYNRDRGTANWVSWELQGRDLGGVDRQNDFRADVSLPAGWPQVEPGDYSRSGYDRGHLVPSADRTANTTANSATFLMTNIIPQTADNNRGVWRELEEYCRDLVRSGKTLYIVAGGYGDLKTLGPQGRVTVPTNTWKAILILDNPQAPIAAQTQVIAVDIPNKKRLRGNWQNYQVTVDQIEQATGYDLFDQLPDDLERAIESDKPAI